MGPDSASVDDDLAGREALRGRIAELEALERELRARIAELEHQLADERRTQAAQRLESLGMLIGGIAHDFNNVLTGVLGFAELALLDLGAGHAAREKVELVVTSARRAAGLTQQLLASAGFDRPLIAPLALNELLRALDPSARTTVGRGTLVVELTDPLPSVAADAAQIRQLVLSLLANAGEALGEHGGRVLLATRAEQFDPRQVSMLVVGGDLPAGLYVRLVVEDNGSGMEPETLARIFDPFFSTKQVGRGLGLAAARSIVIGHNGALAVASEPRRGSSFSVWLPAISPVTEPPQLPPASTQPRGTLLVADDEAVVRTIASQLLGRHGFAVVAAEDGLSALKLFEAGIPDLTIALLDLTMPGMAGDELARALRRARPDVPVVLMSGYSAEEVARRYADLGLAGVLQKPFTADELVLAVERALSEGASSRDASSG